MLTPPNTNGELLEEIERLRMRLEESDAVVEAIRSGIVDAVVMTSTTKESVYTLEGAERPYRLLVEAMEQGVAVLNSEGVILYCNPCLAELLKRSVQNITGCTIDSFAAEADQANITDLWRNVDSKSAHEEILLLRQDGTTFPATLAVSALPLQNLCLLISDLTQQKHYDELVVSKAALLDSEIRYRRLFETAKDGILILDTESGRITDANPFMSELLGYSHEHFLDKELWEIGLFSDKAANEAAVRTLQDKGFIRYEHLPLQTSQGLRVEVEVVANAYREDHHKVIQCNIRDITERSQLEKQMQEQAEVLASVHRSKDKFLAMLSHELRNPLAPISNAVQLLSLQKHEDQLQHQARTIIERQVRHLTRLIDDLLEVSRITTGKIHLQLERVDLNEVVTLGIESARPLIDQNHHELTVSLSPQPIWVHGDPARLEQVVVNLLTNAAKYTVEGGTIAIAVQRQGEESVLRVRDSGVGIAPELLPYVFELFTQAERSLDRSQGGLGIGLALVQQIVDLHGGKVEVNSSLEQGSEFVVHLPIMTPPAASPTSPKRLSVRLVGTSLKVLVVDDNIDSAQSLGLLLEATGHRVQFAYDGPSASQAIRDSRPNVVLLDIGLPGLDGYEVARKIRDDATLQATVLVAMTGYGHATDLQRSSAAGFNYHLVKPVDFGKIKEILATVSEEPN